MDAQTSVQQRDDILYVLNFRYQGGKVRTSTLDRELNALGWTKVVDITSCYVMRKKHDDDIHQNDLAKVLKDHVDKSKHGSEVRFGISKYIPPNQRPDHYEGIDTLFDGY